ncbi:MAG: M3 family metallopeptidase [Proteobacteria bacterium]|nr:M3 family metallopeptidase [Pseudomonadota bacterium]
MTNPLLERHELPPFDQIRAEHAVPAIKAILDENRQALEHILDAGDFTYDSVVSLREALDDRLNQAFSPVGHLNAVMNSEEIREAYNTCIAMLSEYSTEVNQNQALFAAYQAIAGSPEFETLAAEKKKVVENALRDFRLAGVALPEAERQAYAALANELSSLQSTFNNNVLDATQSFSKLVPVERLEGVPENAMSQMRKAAENKGEDGYLVTLDMPCYMGVQRYCQDRVLRREQYIAYGTRASDRGPDAGRFDNSEIMQQILEARLKQARLLGFDHYAALSVERKMARSAEEVLAFLEDLAARSRPAAEKELQEIADFARQHGGPEELEPWDLAFYAEKLKKASFDISEEELRPYFPVPIVLKGMFEVVRRLFDIDVRAVDDMPVWHPDVMTYGIWKDGTLIARFYLDLYARANKRGGAWMDDCRVRRRIEPAGSLQIPVAYLTCNFTNPVGDDPALLNHSEVVTLFHEFGHGLHHMMTQVNVAPVSGINGVAWDAVELPSQFMENFCWQAESLAFISGHYQTREPLPEAMLDKLLAARHFQSAMMMVRQLEFGLFDFRLHVEFDPEEKGQVQQVLDQVRAKVAVVKPPAEYAFQHGFSHIFGGGYAAGYYSYKWAEVLSADAFSKFLEEGIFNRQTGEKFLSTVLENGGVEDAMKLFVAFRGREPEVEALLRQDGLLPDAA